MLEPKATASHLDSTHLRHADARQRCLFMGVERKSAVRGQTDANDPNRKSGAIFGTDI
jgi:hypothetical protein